MKQSQWIIAFGLVVVMVFGVTFAVNYLGESGGGSNPPPPPPPTLDLTFGERMVPPAGVPPLEMETGANGSADFWFVNDNEKTVKLGLIKTSCTCSEAAVYLTGSDWRVRSSAVLAGQLAASQVRLGHDWLGVFSALALTEALRPDVSLQDLTQSIRGDSLYKDESVPVPPGGVGWVRLKWDGKRQSQQPMTVLSADVWMGQTTNTVRLAAGVRYLPAFEIAAADRDQRLGENHPRELPLHRSVVCWSSTRDALNLQAKLASIRGGSESKDPFIVGKPEPLSRQECEQLEKKHQTDPNYFGRVRCAYRIPVTVRDRADDGTLLDIGPFRRLVVVKMTDTDYEEKILLHGTIQGDVYVGGSEDSARVHFQAFDRSKGTTKTVPVWSQTPGLTLEVDTKRTAPFLDVELPAPEKEPDGKQMWKMRVAVKANEVIGQFPRDDDLTLRDCAIYLKSNGPERRTMRIAVMGIAQQR
jgi:hypothetical protein